VPDRVLEGARQGQLVVLFAAACLVMALGTLLASSVLA